MEAMICLSLMNAACVCKCQWMQAILSNYITCYMSNVLQQSPHPVTLSELMNPHWDKGARPCLVTGARTSFHVACKRGPPDLMCCWDITLHLHQATPSVLGSRVIRDCCACHCIASCALWVNSWSPDPNGRQVLGGNEKESEELKMGLKGWSKFTEDF